MVDAAVGVVRDSGIGSAIKCLGGRTIEVVIGVCFGAHGANALGYSAEVVIRCGRGVAPYVVVADCSAEQVGSGCYPPFVIPHCRNERVTTGGVVVLDGAGMLAFALLGSFVLR